MDQSDIVSAYLSGKGMKAIAKEFGLTYTAVRWRLLKAKVQLRSPKEVTDFLRRTRAHNMKIRMSKSGPVGHQGSPLGVGGFYFNKTRGKWVWLRSTFEYIYACWLDRNHIEWDVEVKQAKIDGRWYRPDFFIYENGVLSRITEIKSKWIEGIQRGRSSSVSEFEGVPVERVMNITPFIPIGSCYSSELRAWHQISDSNKKIKKIDTKEEKDARKRDRMARIREERLCAICGRPFIALKSANQMTCGDKKCIYKTRGVRETQDRLVRWPKQRQRIIDLFVAVRVPLWGVNNRPSLKPLYPYLEREGLPIHINTLRGIFGVGSLLDIVKILEGAMNVSE
jgi:hypothetical protein